MEQRQGVSSAAEQAEENTNVSNPAVGGPVPAMNNEDLTRSSPRPASPLAEAEAAATAVGSSQATTLEINNCRRQRQRARVSPAKMLDASDPQVYTCALMRKCSREAEYHM